MLTEPAVVNAHVATDSVYIELGVTISLLRRENDGQIGARNAPVLTRDFVA